MQSRSIEDGYAVRRIIKSRHDRQKDHFKMTTVLKISETQFRKKKKKFTLPRGTVDGYTDKISAWQTDRLTDFMIQR